MTDRTNSTPQPAASRIVVTEAAVSKVWSLMAEEASPNLILRAYITGGGCSGFQYGFTFEEAASTDDHLSEHPVHESEQHLLETDNPCVRLAVDPISWQYLKGASIDYVQDINGERFVIKNPNAKTTCGCGSSFSA